MTLKRYQNINRMLKASVERSPDTYAYCWFNESLDTRGCTWKEYECEVDQVSKSLLALGIKKDNKISVLANTCYQWVLSDMGIVSIGAVTVGIYQSNLARDCEYIINNSDSVLIFVEDEQQLEKLIYIRSDISQLAKVILFKGQSNDGWVLSYEDFLALGNTVSDDELKAAQDNVESEDIASIVYTSGTTGLPKGAMLSHGNITFTTQSVFQSVDIHDGDSTILFLPLAHVFARTILYACLYSTTITFFNRSMDTLLEDLALSQPHWFASVPRIYEKVYGKVNGGAEEKGGLSLKIFHWACGLGAQVSDFNTEKKPLPLNLSLKYAIASKLVFTKLHAVFGGRLRWCISGAAPMNPSIAKFFDGAGIPILEGIGMTENTSFSNLNRIDNYRFGTVGLTGPGIEVKLADDGEFLVRGPNVMQGYYKMPEETAKDIDKDGWLATG
ncbi:MAG: AMP-binding protein, partial [Gammaproteobacteria bacterium]|nr:AMP-binding protein [Gammaproteobacteria bacterium]